MIRVQSDRLPMEVLREESGPVSQSSADGSRFLRDFSRNYRDIITEICLRNGEPWSWIIRTGKSCSSYRGATGLANGVLIPECIVDWLPNPSWAEFPWRDGSGGWADPNSGVACALRDATVAENYDGSANMIGLAGAARARNGLVEWSTGRSVGSKCGTNWAQGSTQEASHSLSPPRMNERSISFIFLISVTDFLPLPREFFQ